MSRALASTRFVRQRAVVAVVAIVITAVVVFVAVVFVHDVGCFSDIAIFRFAAWILVQGLVFCSALR